MLLGICLGLLALAANIVGLAIPYWLYKSVDHTKAYYGIWKACFEVLVNTECSSYQSAPSSLKATQALEILGMVLMAAALLCVILKMSAMRTQTKLPMLAGLLAICAGVLMIIGTIVFATKVKNLLDPDKVLHLHAGFGLCIAGGVVAIISGVLFLIKGGRASPYSEI